MDGPLNRFGEPLEYDADGDSYTELEFSDQSTWTIEEREYMESEGYHDGAYPDEDED